ncbi:hypothetical protein CN088_32985 [Sinorhizobium meliloti]|nr:hypothetical protein [Sinorhizobium meliloti]RVO75917.1 hypothetical protein CN088_32985 [Sinorhizobium meliloti]
MISKYELHSKIISSWEAEGGAPDRSGELRQYGRSFQGDGTYTIYHVTSGEVAEIGRWRLDGLSPRNAARALHILNDPYQGEEK